MRGPLTNALKLAVSLSIIAYVVVDVQKSDPETFTRLISHPKDWGLLAGAWCCLAGGLVLGWSRWFLLIRTLGLRCRLRDAWRLGFLAFMLDFTAVGTLGGDLMRAALLGREQERRWGDAMATVVVDRLLGLFGLSLVATIAILVTDLSTFVPEIRTLAHATVAFACAGMVAALLLLAPGFHYRAVADALGRIPYAGGAIAQMIDAVRLYRNRRRTVFLIGCASLVIPCVNVTGFYLLARGLPSPAPSLGDHFLIIPLAMVSGAFPLPMDALGVFDYVMGYLYEHVSAGTAPAGQGLVVALSFRVVTLIFLTLGAPLYIGARRELAAALEQSHERAEA